MKAYAIPAEQADYVTYTYTLNGKQKFVTDANGNKAELRYDGFDRQSHWFMPSKTTPGQVSTTDYEQYGYDAAGNRMSLRKRDGRTLTFAYDNLNRMTSKLIPDGCAPIQVGPCTPASATRDVFTAYDLMGRQLTARYDSQAGADAVTNAWNRFGEMTSSSISMVGFSKTLTHLYDEASRRTRVTHPDGQAFTYAYDPLDRLSGVYEGVGTTTSLDMFGYDNRGLLASRAERLGSGATYTYDPIGRLASQSDSFTGGTGNVAWTFAHNPASQIVSETRDNDGYAYTGLTPANRAYAVNGLNQYSTVAGTALTYDANGNLIGDGTNAYVYDAESRLVSATAAGQTATLTYDPLGRLWQLVKGSSNSRFLTDGDAMLAEYDGAGSMTARYVHGSNMAADDPLVWYQGAAITGERWLHANHQGSVVGVSDANGGSPSINAYDEYGVPAAGNVGRFQYTGQIWLSEIGRYYYKARFYDPSKGRFLQVDPVGYDDQVNLYAYVANDPVNGTDPKGTYICGGNSQECASAEKAINNVRIAARDPNLSRSERQTLRQIASFYGKANERNGVGVIFATPKQIQAATNDRSAHATVVRGRKTGTIAVVLPKNFQNAYSNLRGNVSSIGRDLRTWTPEAERANTLAHEGKHGVDIRAGNRPSQAPAEDAGRAVSRSMGTYPFSELPQERFDDD